MDEYFLQVIKDGETAKWPRPEEELVIGSQPLNSGFTQYWAYSAESGKEAEDLPAAEILASENKTSTAAILIDQKTSTLLTIVLVKDGHAWAHTESDAKNLEDSISEMLDFAREKFGLSVQHFMTTGRVSPEIEERLDKLEGEETEKSEKSEETEEIRESEEDEGGMSIKPLGNFGNDYGPKLKAPVPTLKAPSGNKPGGIFSKMAVILPIILLLVVFGGAVKFKDKILNKLSFGKPPIKEVTVTPTPMPTPTPTPALDRNKYQVRVLNGTTKAGAAGTLADDLKSKGWEILAKGNAKNQATDQTTVSVKKGTDDLVTKTMVLDLTGLEATLGATLSATDKADVEVVIGKK